MAVKWIFSLDAWFPSLLLRTTILYCINFLALQLMVSKGALRTQFSVCGPSRSQEEDKTKVVLEKKAGYD